VPRHDLPAILGGASIIAFIVGAVLALANLTPIGLPPVVFFVLGGLLLLLDIFLAPDPKGPVDVAPSLAASGQAQDGLVARHDQEWLGRWARQWATDPANKFCDLANLNELDKQLFSLFDSIEQCRDDVDAKLDSLHEAWKHSGLVTQTLYRIKFHYLFRGVGYEVSQRAGELNTDSAKQTLLNWNRVQNVYDGQDGSYRAAEAWIGPATGSAGSGASTASEEPAARGRYVKGVGYFYPDGTRIEGFPVDLVMSIGGMWSRWRARQRN
jgi:hypothetical protein